MHKRFAEMEQEAAKLKEMQQAVEQQLNAGLIFFLILRF
jgi:hypothetical protein